MNSKNNYITFLIMLLVSFITMYAVMFLNVFSTSHIMLSFTRTYMTLLMVSPMAISMILFKWKIYPKVNWNYAILGIALLVFISSLYGLRKQKPIGDVQWMKAMIPHHSSAILTSSYAHIKDPEVKELAEEIIQAQEQEITKMKSMLERIKQ